MAALAAHDRPGKVRDLEHALVLPAEAGSTSTTCPRRPVAPPEERAGRSASELEFAEAAGAIGSCWSPPAATRPAPRDLERLLPARSLLRLPRRGRAPGRGFETLDREPARPHHSGRLERRHRKGSPGARPRSRPELRG